MVEPYFYSGMTVHLMLFKQLLLMGVCVTLTLLLAILMILEIWQHL